MNKNIIDGNDTPKRNFGWVGVSVVMIILHLFLGKKGSLYVVVWGYICYFAYCGNLLRIRDWLKYIIILNAVVGFIILLSSDQKIIKFLGFESLENFAVALLIPLAINGFLFWHISDQIKNSSKNKSNEKFNLTKTQETKNSVDKFSLGEKKTKSDEKYKEYDINEESDNWWEKALNEYESDKRNLGLYARLYSEHHGNELLIKASYLKIRSF